MSKQLIPDSDKGFYVEWGERAKEPAFESYATLCFGGDESREEAEANGLEMGSLLNGPYGNQYEVVSRDGNEYECELLNE